MLWFAFQKPDHLSEETIWLETQRLYPSQRPLIFVSNWSVDPIHAARQEE